MVAVMPALLSPTFLRTKRVVMHVNVGLALGLIHEAEKHYKGMRPKLINKKVIAVDV